MSAPVGVASAKKSIEKCDPIMLPRLCSTFLLNLFQQTPAISNEYVKEEEEEEVVPERPAI